MGIDTRNNIEILEPETHIIADYNFTLLESNYRLVQGIVTSATVVSQGIGYTLGATVTFSAPPLTSKSVTATGIAITNNLGFVSALNLVNGGTGYNLGAGITFSPPPPGVNTSIATGIATVTGSNITSVAITNPGFGYTQAPTVFVTGVSGGSGGIVTAFIQQGQVTGIVITNTGFGYTSEPTVTISAPIGTGATAFAVLSLGTSTVTRFSQIGAANTSNSSGINYGVAATSIGVPWSASSTIETINIYRIAKNKLHYTWVNENGTAIVSGGLLPSPSASTLNIQNNIKLFARNMSGYTESELDFSISLTSGLFVPTFYGQTFTGLTTTPVSFTMNSADFFGSYAVNDYGGFAVIRGGTGTITVLYKDTVSGGSQQWTIGNYSNLVGYPGVLSTANPGRDEGSTNREKNMRVVFLTTSGSATAVNVLNGVTSSVYGPQTLATSPLQYILPKANATTLAANKINNYRASSFQYLGITYPWIKSDYNILIGYQDGSVELYGEVTNTVNAVNGGLQLISTWSPDGSKITSASSLIDWSFPNKSFIYVGTQNGNLFAYDGNGDYVQSNVQKTLSSTESPTLLGTLAIPSAYGYALDVQNYTGGLVLVSTSNNYVLVVQISTMTIVSYVVIPGAIKSIIGNVLQDVSTIETNNRMIVQATAQDPADLNNNRAYAYLFPATRNVEMGLSFANQAGAFQSLTTDGSFAGTPFTSVYNASTSDTFTLIIDSSKPTG